jgi:hypothetical protein
MAKSLIGDFPTAVPSSPANIDSTNKKPTRIHLIAFCESISVTSVLWIDGSVSKPVLLQVITSLVGTQSPWKTHVKH